MSDFKNDDFDSVSDDNFDDFSSENSLKEAWQTNPLLKIFVIVAGVIIVIAAIMIFGGKGEDQESKIAIAPDQKEVLGGEISQNYAEVLDEVNDQRLETAVNTGGSTIPMLVNPEDKDLLSPTEELPPVQEFDPLATFRSAVTPEAQEAPVVEEPVLVESPQVLSPAPQPVPAPNPEAVQALAQAMAKSVGDILGNHAPQAPKIQIVAPMDYYELKAAEKQAALTQQFQGQQVDTNGDGIPDTYLNNTVVGQDEFGNPITETITETILVPAGTINYAQILIEANSDVPGPVLAQLVSGPMNGARLIGEFDTVNEYLVISFSSIVVDGINQPVEAIAIDPGTTLPGVATEVDNRYFERVLLPAGAKFLEGIGAAIAEDTQTTVTVSGDTVIEETEALSVEQELGKGVEEGFKVISEFAQDEADGIEPLIRVARGTPVGVFFTAPVLESGNQQ